MTSSNILFIVGLPGSGKTTLANQINKDNDNKYLIIDDPKNFKTDILPYIHQNLIISDPNLCFLQNRKSAVDIIKKNNPNIKIDWIYFENNPEACLQNATRRNDKNVKSFIKNLNQFYEIPEGSVISKVYSN